MSVLNRGNRHPRRHQKFDQESMISWKRCKTWCKLLLIYMEVACRLSVSAKIGDLKWPQTV